MTTTTYYTKAKYCYYSYCYFYCFVLKLFILTLCYLHFRCNCSIVTDSVSTKYQWGYANHITTDTFAR